MAISKLTFPRESFDFSVVLPLFSPVTLRMEVESDQVQDIYSDVRKHSKLLDPVKAENYKVLVILEEQIMKKYGIQRSEITPIKYFYGIMSQLNTKTEYYRSVGRIGSVSPCSFYICSRWFFLKWRKESNHLVLETA